MSTEKSQNVQDVFLNHVRKNKLPVTVFLINGVKLQGVISWFDNFSVLLRRDGHVQLVYKHAISTVMPAVAIQLFEPPKEEAEDALQLYPVDQENRDGKLVLSDVIQEYILHVLRFFGGHCSSSFFSGKSFFVARAPHNRPDHVVTTATRQS